jgi:hypothetical protein
VAIHLAVALAEMVTRLLLAGPSGAATGRRVPDPWLRDMPHEPHRLGPQQLPDWLRAGSRRIAGTVRAGARRPSRGARRPDRRPMPRPAGRRTGRLARLACTRPQVFADVVAQALA